MAAKERTRTDGSRINLPSGRSLPFSGASSSARTACARTSASAWASKGTRRCAAAARSASGATGVGLPLKASPGAMAAPRRARMPRPQTPWRRSKALSDLVAASKRSAASGRQVSSIWARRRTRWSACESSLAKSADEDLVNPPLIRFATVATASGFITLLASSVMMRPAS